MLMSDVGGEREGGVKEDSHLWGWFHSFMLESIEGGPSGGEMEKGSV